MNENPTGGEVVARATGQGEAQVRAPAQEVVEGQEQASNDESNSAPKNEQSQGETEIRNYMQEEMAADGRICALFVAGVSSSPVWQYALVYRDLVKNVPGIAIKYVDFGRDVFDSNEISGKIAHEVKHGEFSRYMVVGMGMGGQLVYDALKKLDGDVAQRTTGVLFSTPTGAADIRNVSNVRMYDFMMWVLNKDGLASVLDKFRKLYWMMFGEKKDTNGQADDVLAAYARRRAYESQFPITTLFAESRYFYGFKADKPIQSRLVIVSAVDDNFIKNSGRWDKLTQNIEHRTIAGGYGDSVLRYGEYARIVADEAGREEQIMKRAMENFG
jgi:hypothetical protein